MQSSLSRLAAAATLAIGACGGAAAETASATFVNSQGAEIGKAELIETAPGGVLIKARVKSLPEGWHAFHIHETGTCTAPDFKSAGGHYNPHGTKHGILAEGGRHAGDMPNVYVGADGELAVEVMAEEVTLRDGPGTLFDGDGSAIVMHMGPDDYLTDPAGAAGARIACAVIERDGE